ncbi:MAG: LemA family protein [Bacteroidia bacterium]|nr:LemA family protein [Bacteroidia bacterium]
MKNRGFLIALAAVAAIGLLIYSSTVGRYNRLVRMQEAINQQWSQVKNQYQRRSDLIPNVISTVKGAANFEQETLQNIVDARARVGQIVISDDVVSDPEKLAEFERAQARLSQGIGRLIAVSENYPDLKSSQLFRDLVVQLEGTENRISVERKRFIESIGAYNTYLRQFPTNLIGGMMGFEKMTYYEGDEGNETAPKVTF